MPLDGTNHDTPALRAPLLAEMPVAPRTTQADVLALYDRAIKRLTRRNP